MPAAPAAAAASESSMSCRRRRCLTASCIVLALLCIALGAAITFVFDRVFSDQLKVLMPLANGSMSYQGWEKVPNEIYFQMWIFNVTNPDAVVAGAAPALDQLGPFTFIEKRSKRDIQFHPNDTVSFRELFQYVFRPDKSIGNLSDFRVTSVNMPYIVTSFQMRYSSVYLRNIVNGYLLKYSGGLFVTRTAEEILLGYTDGALKSLEGLVRVMAPSVRFQSTTGLFVGQNNTDKGVLLVNTGRANLSQFNRVERWNGADRLDMWSLDWANQVSGTDGSMYAPRVRPGDRLTLFVPDICRPIDIVFTGHASIESIPVLQFAPPPELLMNATLWPPNRAFCLPDCLDTGVLNVTACQDGVPIVISSPHFFGAPSYLRAVTGLAPTPDMETEVNVEPNTGFVFGAQRKMQSNVIFQRVPGFTQTEQLSESLLLMPLMWLNESARIEPEKAALFRRHLLAPIQIVACGQWALIAVGLVWTAVTGVTCSVLARRRSQRRRHRRWGWRPHADSDAAGTSDSDALADAKEAAATATATAKGGQRAAAAAACLLDETSATSREAGSVKMVLGPATFSSAL